MSDLTINQLSDGRKALEAEIRQKQALLESYAAVEEDLKSKARNGQVQPNLFKTTSPSSHDYGRITRLVRSAINGNRGGFTIRAIHHVAQREEPDISIASVTTAINRILASGDIRVQRRGKGRRPNIYEIAK